MNPVNPLSALRASIVGYDTLPEGKVSYRHLWVTQGGSLRIDLTAADKVRATPRQSLQLEMTTDPMYAREVSLTLQTSPCGKPQ